MAEATEQYESWFYYRVRFGRLKMLETGGGVVLGEEHRLLSSTLESAKKEFAEWLAMHKEECGKEIILNLELLEIRTVRR